MSSQLRFETEKLSEAINKAFYNAKDPVAASELAAVYSVLAAQQEALLAIYLASVDTRSNLRVTEEAIEAEEALKRATKMFGDPLRALAALHVPGEANDE